MITMENLDYWSTRCIKLDPENTVENMKHLKIQHLSNNLKNTAAVSSTQKKFKTQNILCWSLSVNMPSSPPEGQTNSKFDDKY